MYGRLTAGRVCNKIASVMMCYKELHDTNLLKIEKRDNCANEGEPSCDETRQRIWMIMPEWLVEQERHPGRGLSELTTDHWPTRSTKVLVNSAQFQSKNYSRKCHADEPYDRHVRTGFSNVRFVRYLCNNCLEDTSICIQRAGQGPRYNDADE